MLVGSSDMPKGRRKKLFFFFLSEKVKVPNLRKKWYAKFAKVYSEIGPPVHKME